MEVIRYIQYHKFKADHVKWLTFNEDTWLHLPHTTYATALVSLVNPGPRFYKAVANMASTSPKTPTHIYHVPAHT